MEKEKRERWIKVRVSETEKSVIDEKIGEFPCRLLGTENHHFAIAPFP
jgi:hypothetical protein